MGDKSSMAAVLLALASAALLGAGVVITQFGLRTIHPLSGAAISIPSFTLVFVLLSPILLYGDTIVWRAVPIFAAVGLVFPSVLTLLTFTANRSLGPVVTSALGNLSPLFAVALAVILLHEPMRLFQFVGLFVSVAGAFILSVTRTADMRDWRTWALALPLCAAFLRGVIPPVLKIGLAIWPSPIGAGLVAYIVSTLTVLVIERVRTGRFMVQGPLEGRLWFALTGVINGVGTLLLYAAVGAGPITVVAPVNATYPLVTMGLSALVLSNVRITPRLLLGVGLAVAGVVLILIG
jgi:drug/metabolite transporter (DMT)-like permease